MSMLMASQAALLNDAEPVAASDDTFVLKFKHEIHCQMAMDNTSFVETVEANISKLTQTNYSFIGIPEDQWHDVRENFIKTHAAGDEEHTEGEGAPQTGEPEPEDSFVSEAAKLVGEDLLEVKE